MKKRRKRIVDSLAYKNIACKEMSEKEIAQTSELFSNHYGVWSSECPEESKRGKQIKLSANRIKSDFVEKPDRYIAMAFYKGELVGHIFYLKRKGEKSKDIIWILQLVVAKPYRGHGIGTKLLHSIWGLSDCYAWGLFTSNPMTINALEKATMRKVSPDLIEKRFGKLKSVAYDIFDDSSWLCIKDGGVVNTNFFIDHSRLKDKIRKVYRKQSFLLTEDLPEGYEWLAFTFNSQPPHISNTLELDAYLDYSNDIIQIAYSNMDMKSQQWSSRHKNEVEYICSEYIKPSDKVIDVGCGIGRHTIELNSKGIETTGIDFSQQNIKYANECYPKDCFICSDIRYYKPKEKYDVALALYDVVGSFPNEKDNLAILKTIRKCLKSNGMLIMSVMNMNYTRKRCNNIIQSIDLDVEKLLNLPSSQTMQKSGDVFDGNFILIDDLTGTVYRKEQFLSKSSLPSEYVIRDRRYTLSGVTKLLNKAGFEVIKSHHFNAKNMSEDIGPDKGKEIFIVAKKLNSPSLRFRYIFSMPKAWK